MLTPLNEWRVPVLLQGHSVLLFTVAKSGDHYEVVDMGGAQLAKELELKTPHAGYSYLVRLFEAHADFVAGSDNAVPTQNLSFLPLSSAQLFITNSRKIPASASYTWNDLSKLTAAN